MTKKYRIFLAFGLTLALAAMVQAKPGHYGTGLYHWVKQCDYGSYGTTEYVGAASCPPIATLPPECTCVMTTHDFPVGNPYPYLIATGITGEDGGAGTGNPVVHVTVDKAQVIDCNLNPTAGTCTGEGKCRDLAVTLPADPTRLDAGVVESVESLRDDYEEYFDAPVTFLYRVTTDR